MNLSGGTVSTSGLNVEVIEDLLPLREIQVVISHLPQISRVTLEPQGRDLKFVWDGHRLKFTVDEFTCHQMVVLHEP